MPKLGDAVLYTTPGGSVWPAIVARIHDDGSLDLFGLCAVGHLVEWLDRVKVTGAIAGDDEACGRWSPR